MSIFKRVPIKKEFLNFLRNSDVFSTSLRGVTTTTDSGTTTITGDETITLSKSGVKNIRTVRYNGNTLSFGYDYTIDIDNNQVTLLNIDSGNDYSIEFDYSSTGDKIYPDYPYTKLTMNSYPRLGFDIYGQNSVIGAFGNVNFVNFRFSIVIYASSRDAAESYVDRLREIIINAQKSLYYVSYIRPLDTSQVQEVQGKHGLLFSVALDVESKNNMEAN